MSVVGLVALSIFGLWDNTMRTMAVVGTATGMSVAIAVPLGILMAKSERFQAAMRPMLDLMQVMPAFVYLIPAIFFLGIGKPPAVMATMIYAVPPAMRLTNLGIRLVSPELVEAAKAFGTTPWQLLVKIQLPLARPTIMAGVNQTVMMALAMVVIAAMVGAPGLGSDVFEGVSRLEFGKGLLGGLGIVILAIIIDRNVPGPGEGPAQRARLLLTAPATAIVASPRSRRASRSASGAVPCSPPRFARRIPSPLQVILSSHPSAALPILSSAHILRQAILLGHSQRSGWR